jgi:hypothetical protein
MAKGELSPVRKERLARLEGILMNGTMVGAGGTTS